MLKKFLLTLVFLALAHPIVTAEEATPAWPTDYPAALEAAARTGRPVLLNFTGTDWCVWCHRLRDEVFQTPYFTQYSNASLVLVELDFPRKKNLPPELKKQNDALAEKFGVQGYPTLILLDANGRELARLGYMQGGPKTFVRELKRHLSQNRPPQG